MKQSFWGSLLIIVLGVIGSRFISQPAGNYGYSMMNSGIFLLTLTVLLMFNLLLLSRFMYRRISELTGYLLGNLVVGIALVFIGLSVSMLLYNTDYWLIILMLIISGIVYVAASILYLLFKERYSTIFWRLLDPKPFSFNQLSLFENKIDQMEKPKRRSGSRNFIADSHTIMETDDDDLDEPVELHELLPPENTKLKNDGSNSSVENSFRSFHTYKGKNQYATDSVQLEKGMYKIQFRFPKSASIGVELINTATGHREGILFLEKGSGSKAFQVKRSGRYIFEVTPIKWDEKDISWEFEFKPA